MNKNITLVLCAGLVTGVAIGYGISTAIKSTSSDLVVPIPEISKLNDEYLAKIEGFGIPLADYTKNLEQVLATTPPEQLEQFKANEGLFKGEILENLINQTVITAQANEEGFLENPERQRLFQMLIRQALFTLYLQENMPSDDNAFAPSKGEIDQVFQQSGRELTARGLNGTQVRQYITAQLSQQKRQRWVFEFVTKIREQYRIERNTSLIEAQGISSGSVPSQVATEQE